MTLISFVITIFNTSMVPTPRKVAPQVNPEPVQSNGSIDQMLQASGDSGADKPLKKHLTKDERLAKHSIQCQNLISNLTTNVCPPDLAKKEVRNIKNQAKTHQWDPKSKMFAVKLNYCLCFPKIIV